MPVKERPIGLALIVCDQIIEDKLSNKRTLVGLFNHLGSTRFPCSHPALGVFVSLTSGHGEYACQIVCRHTESEAVAFSAEGRIVCQNPLQVVEIAFNVAGAVFPQPGHYWLEFRVDEVPLMMRRIFLDLHQGPPGGPPPAGQPPAAGRN